MDLELDKIKHLMEALEKSKLKKLAIKKGDFEIVLEKEDSYPAVVPKYPVEIKETKQEIVKVEAKEEGKIVKSPMVGTFYASPAPDQPTFVKLGGKVEEDTVLCLIEAMKVMNEVKAGKRGTIAEIFVENGKPVEFGSKLFRIV